MLLPPLADTPARFLSPLRAMRDVRHECYFDADIDFRHEASLRRCHYCRRHADAAAMLSRRRERC